MKYVRVTSLSPLAVSPRGNVEVSAANHTVDHGDSVTINCTAGGGPGTMYVWLRNGTERLCFNCSSVANGTTTDVQSNHVTHILAAGVMIVVIISLQVSLSQTLISW